jgi:hypothetical protein
MWEPQTPWNYQNLPQMSINQLAVSPQILPSAPSNQLPGHKSIFQSTGIGHVFDFTGCLPAAPFPPMKENIPPPELPDYDSFFSSLREPSNGSSTLSNELRNLSQLNAHAPLSPLGRSLSLDTLYSFDSPGQLSASSTSTTTSLQNSSALFSGLDEVYLPSDSPQFIIEDSMDLTIDTTASPITKRKQSSESVSAYSN